MAHADMTPEPAVSVIIPCFNYGHFLRQALESVQAQTLAEWECIVVDDGSTDETRAVAEHFAAHDRRIHYVFQENGGHAAARNRGLRQARGRFIQFLDADDLIQSRKLEFQAACLDARPSVDIVYGDHRYFTDETAQEALNAPLDVEERREAPEQDTRIQRCLMERNLMVTHAPLFRRRLLETVGLLDTRLKAAEDWDFWLRAALSGARFHLHNWDGARALVRHHAASYSRDRGRMLEAILQLRAKVEGLTEDPLLRKISRVKRLEEEAALGKHDAIYGSLGRGFRRLWRAGVQARSLKWLGYALLLPLLRLRLLRALPPLHRALRHME